MWRMSNQQQPKPSSYINVAADLNFLQRIICCNHDIANGPADTPPVSPKGIAQKFNIAIELPVSLEMEPTTIELPVSLEMEPPKEEEEA